MKFVSWNVNGLRACIQKGFLDEFHKLNADFFCLQETKLSEGQLQLELPGYEQYWCYAEKKGYSGTAIFTKHTPLSVSYGIGVPELDNEGRVITLEYREFYLVTCYTPNAQRALARIAHRMKWDEAFRDYLKKLDEVKPVVLCGDLNVAHKEIDLKNPGSNRNNAGFSDQERDSFQKTLDLGFTDTFRHLYPDATGRYSWWSYMFHARENNAGWRIDYFLVSDRLKDQIYRADIHSAILGSDHCPVSLELDILVNGGLWSPEYIPPAPPAADSTPPNEPKASPVSGKAFAAIIPLLLFVIAGIVGIAWMFADPSLPQTDQPGAETLGFETTVYDTPFTQMEIITTGFKPEIMFPNSVQLTDGQNSFYVSSTDGLDTANLFLRVEGKNIVPEDYSITLDADSKSITMDQFGFLSQAAILNISVVPYYSDALMTQCMGWLIWCSTELMHPVLTQLNIDRISDSAAQVETVSLIPYLDSANSDLQTTASLLYHISSQPEIYNTMTAPLTKPSITSSYYDSYDTRLIALMSEYPAVLTFVKRSDAVEQLMTSPYGKIDFYNILLSTQTLRDLMSVEEEVNYLTGQYSTAANVYIFENHHTNLDLLSTEELLVWAMSDAPGYWLASSSTEAVRTEVYTYIWGKSIYLREFENRTDAVAVLMRTEQFGNFYLYGDAFWSSSILWINGPDVSAAKVADPYIPYYLLSMETYRLKMTPFEEALFLTNNYVTCPNRPIFKAIDIDLDSLDTASLIDLYVNNRVGVSLSACSGTEAMYYVCQLESRIDPILHALMQREDAAKVLKTKISQGRQYGLLYYALTYTPEQYTRYGPTDIARILVSDTTVMDNVYLLVHGAGYTYEEACNFFPILKKFLSEPYALMKLYDIANLKKNTDEDITELKAKLPYIQDLSMFSSDLLIYSINYVDGLKGELLTAVQSAATFQDLCAIHPFVNELLNREQIRDILQYGKRVDSDYDIIFGYFLTLPEIQADPAE